MFAGLSRSHTELTMFARLTAKIRSVAAKRCSFMARVTRSMSLASKKCLTNRI